MIRARTFQNPYLDRHLGIKNIVPLQEETTAIHKEMVGAVEEIERTLNPAIGRARYSKNGVLHCVQMLDMLPWWRRLVIPLGERYVWASGVKYLEAGKTNIFYRAQEWIAGRAGKSTLRIV